MLEIKIQGRGGQGAQKAGQLLALAAFEEGKYVQAYSTYGGARRGASVSSFIRIDDRPIRLRCDIEKPDAILCFDASLLSGMLHQGAAVKTLVLVNSSRPPQAFSELGNYRIYTIDGKAIAGRNDLGRIVNTALVGAFTALINTPRIANLLKVVETSSPAKVQQNISACREGYDLLQEALKGQEGLA